MELKEGLVLEKLMTVTDQMSAANVGSGLVDVFSTPSMIAFIERTCSKAIIPFLDKQHVSVGVEINVKHIAPSKIGAQVKCVARISKIEKNKVLFEVVVTDNDKIVGTGNHTRCIVNKQKFLDNLKK